MTEAEYAVLAEAWKIGRQFPAEERPHRLNGLVIREEDREIVTAVLVAVHYELGRYEEAAMLAARMRQVRTDAWSLAASSVAALAIEGPAHALEVAEEALKVDPSNAFAINAALVAAMMLKKRKKSSEYASQLAAIDPDDSEHIVAQIVAVYATGDFDRARQLMSEAPKSFNDSVGFYLATAYFASHEGRYSEAEDLVAKASALEPHVASYKIFRASLLVRAKRTREAEELARRVLDVNPRSERALQVLLTSAQVRRDSVLYFQRAAALDKCTPFRVAMEHCRAGERLYGQGSREDAARAYQLSVNSDHAFARRTARLELIKIRMYQRRWSVLTPMLTEFDKESPQPLEAVLARASIAGSRRDWNEAIAILETFEDEDCNDWLNRFYLDYLFWAHRLDRVIDVATNLLARPDCSEETAFFAILGLYRAQKDEDGDKQLARFVERFPDGQLMYWMQAKRLRIKGDKAAARAISAKLLPQMRRWNPQPRRQGPVGAWFTTIGRQFKRRFVRW